MPEFGCGHRYGHLIHSGQPISDWDSREIAIYEEPFVERDFAPSLGLSASVPIISARVKKLFEEKFSDGLQFLPLRLQKDDGTGEVLGYYGLNVLRVCDCVSIPHSGNMLPFEIVLAKERMPDMDMFAVKHLAECVVTDEVVRAVKTARFTGFAFEPIKTI